MEGKRKNTTLLIVLVFLIGITAFLLISEGQKKTEAEDHYFSIEDTGNISKIVMTGKGYEHVFTHENEKWQINGRYAVDKNLMEALQTILQKATVKRPVPEARKEKVKQIIDNKGVKVAIYGKNYTLLRSFMVAGSEDREDSYFYDKGNNQAFIMYIPGYNSYIAGIFQLELNEWRNKLIFSSTWRSLQSLSVNYHQDTARNFQILFDKGFFKIPGIQEVDTALMMGYLENLEYLKADRLLGDVTDPKYKNLLQKKPFLEIAVTDIDTSKNNTVQLYPHIEEDPYVLASDDKHKAMLIRYQDIVPFLKTKDYFEEK